MVGVNTMKRNIIYNSTNNINRLPARSNTIPRDRRCVLCNSKDTYQYRKNGKIYSRWSRIASGFICTKCFYKSPKERQRLRQYTQNNRSHIRQLSRKWYRKDPARTAEMESEKRKRKRQRALLLVGRGLIKCINCGCNKPEFLEVNHINGGGSKENKKSSKFYSDLLAGRRGIEDLELRCKVCNVLHYSEKIYGKLPSNIIWLGNNGVL
jgi:hypothetical protein